MEPKFFPHDDYGDSYKFGVKFEEDSLFKLEQAVLALGHNAEHDWTAKNPHDDGTIFFKLKTDKEDTKFTTEINVPIKPAKLKNDKISTDMDVTIDVGIGGWYQKSAKKYGLTLKLKKVTFGTAEPKTSRRKRVSPEEEE
jgi:hypothetical protein